MEGRTYSGRGAKGQPRAELDLTVYAVLGRLAAEEKGGHPSAISSLLLPQTGQKRLKLTKGRSSFVLEACVAEIFHGR